jgi:Protein of unknown function (DUF1769)
MHQKLHHSNEEEDDQHKKNDGEHRTSEMPDDPTVEESIECVIAASQGELADLLKHYDQHVPATPSTLQQSLLKNRSFDRVPARFRDEAQHRAPQSPYRSVPYDHVVPAPRQPVVTTTTSLPISKITKPPVAVPPHVHQQHCDGSPTSIPPASPLHWPQRPLLLRPTPHSGTIVKGVRFVDDTDYLWTPAGSSGRDGGDHTVASSSSSSRHHRSWMHALHTRWGMARDNATTGAGDEHDSGESCCCLPINSGDELPGQTLVTDFESELFVGTLLLRIRNSHGTVRDDDDDDHHHRLSEGYFYGLNRRYQVVIRGRFKKAIPWTECFTGFQYVC